MASPVSREDLYKQIWDEPMLKVASRHEISGSFLTRVCRRLNIPRPPMGHWVKAAVGKAPDRPALPLARPGDEIEWCRDGRAKRMPGTLPKPPAPESRGGRRGSQSAASVLLAGAREHFLAGKESELGYLRPSKRRIVDLYVSRNTLDRALAFASDLFAALGKRGYPVVFPGYGERRSRPELDERPKPGGQRYVYGAWGGPDRPTIVMVGTVAIGLTIFEVSEEVEMRHVGGKYVRVDQLPVRRSRSFESTHEWTTRRDAPSGRLCLRAASTYWRAPWEKRWAETTPGTISRKIRGVVRELEAAAPVIANLVEEKEREAELQRQRWEVERIERERKELERRRAENIIASRKQLVEIIDAWGAAMRVNTFFEDAERRVQRLEPDERLALAERLRAARRLLGSTNPLDGFRDWRAPQELPETGFNILGNRSTVET